MLVVLADDETIAGRSFANLPQVTTTSFGQLSAHDVLRNDWIVFSDRTLPGSDAFAGGAAAEAPAGPEAAAGSEGRRSEAASAKAATAPEADAPEAAASTATAEVADTEESDADA